MDENAFSLEISPKVLGYGREEADDTVLEVDSWRWEHYLTCWESMLKRIFQRKNMGVRRTTFRDSQRVHVCWKKICAR